MYACAGVSFQKVVSNPEVGQTIAFCMLCLLTGLASTYIASAFTGHSTSFPPNFSNPQRWNVYTKQTSDLC